MNICTMIFRWLSPFDPKLSMGSSPTPEALAKSELIERDALVCIEYPREIGAAGTKVGGLGSPWGGTPSHHGTVKRSTWRIWGSPIGLRPRHFLAINLIHDIEI